MPAVSAGGSGPVSGPASAMALAAGLFGALASTAAKFSLGADSVLELVNRGMGEWLHILLRVGCGGMAFLFNALMWIFFAKALRYSSSAQASVTTIASNFLSTSLQDAQRCSGRVHLHVYFQKPRSSFLSGVGQVSILDPGCSYSKTAAK
ncbi:transmembrane protein 42a isoform X2 [Chiloscyllium plagiosum]|uniref:transmembrane protein 42a isoform X2 n=1 Tax=Chiloscyllium plagiosum TaxID=36176 RepID=UPI001CB872F5|nr:transmembrane protein 42a isoform X2 [Chiloscyllium plagiosum]